MADQWRAYFERTKDHPPRRLLVKALAYLGTKGSALDLGAGALNDVKYLLDQKFAQVTAVDKEPVAEELANTLPAERFTYVISSFEDLDLPENAYDLVNAQFALPFVHPEAFDTVLTNVINSLKPGGVFTGQFFGDRDSWKALRPDITFHTREEAERLLAGLEMLHFEEEEKDAITALGEPKHWHVFHFIAKK